MNPEELKERWNRACHVVFFGGAGVSTASGIPDFRGGDGLYAQKNNTDTDVPPEEILSVGYLRRYPAAFYAYYRTHMLYPDAKPNRAHTALARLEAEGKLSAVITQNIDGLHQAAGSRNVMELHGSVTRNYCVRCGARYSLTWIRQQKEVPYCEACGGFVRPDVVLYGEGLDETVFARAEEEISRADLLVVGGTSLTVYPAASLVTRYRGSHLVILNRTPTPCDGRAELVLRDPIEKILGDMLDD